MSSFLLLLAAQAASTLYSPAYEQCMASGDAAAGVQAAMQDCIGDEFGVQDARLNQAYVMTMRGLPAKRRTTLRGLQRQWLAAKERRCRVGGIGSLDRFVSTQCHLDQTVRRRLFLERYR